MNRNLINIEKILTALIITVVIISSSLISAKMIDTENFNIKINEAEQTISKLSTGLAPRANVEKSVFKTAVGNNNLPESMVTSNKELSNARIMDGYNANCPSIAEGPVSFDINDPGTITLLQATQSNDFLSGGTWNADERWICCENGSGVLWEVDPDDGTMTSIGGGGIPLNGLAWDPMNNQMYGASDTELYCVDYETGIIDLIGNFGDGPSYMIGIAFDKYGILYGWDIGTDNLWSIDQYTGFACNVGPLGIDINYAQDGDVDLYYDVLYLTAYTTKGQLYECDKETGKCKLIGDLQDGAQITASIIKGWCPPDHDLGIKSINYPQNGYASPEVPVQATVRNYGVNTEISDVNMQVIKYEENSIIFEENFSGTFPPEGWTTDWWNQSYTNIAGGEPPEARCYNYDQYNGSDYFDNYLMSPPINLTGIEKINLKFRFAVDVYYDNYCSFYLKYRKNSTSPWKDATPWTNPISGDQEADFWEISFYDYGESLGDEFQFKFEYLGYYYYFNYWYLDNLTITSFNCSLEYNETIKDVEIPAGYQVNVDFPTWTPTYWQDPDYENTWQDYQVKACTLLDDEFPGNDRKEKTIELFFPWMHDIEITSIDSPSEDGPGKIYPVTATIKNVGQYPECCIPINISIGEQVILDTLLTEESWDTVPPDGWTDEHKDYASDYGWNKSYTSYSGGSSPEARLLYYYALEDYKFYSYAFDTSDYSVCQLEFLSYINHYSGQGFYSLEAGYSYDGENWYSAWSVAPGSSGSYEVSVQFESEYDTTYIGFWVKGDPWYMNYWYIDNVEVKSVDLVTEYTDNMCQGPDIEPGESVTFEFDEWTPDFLQYETTGSKDYIVKAEINMEGDNNSGNDISSERFTLNYWHDTKIDIESPYLGREPEDWLGFDDGTAVNSIGLTSGGTFQYAIRLTPDELAEYAGSVINSVKRHHDYQTPFTMSGRVIIYGQGTSTHPGDMITEQPFSCYEADWHEIPLDELVPISGDEDIWISIEVTHAAGQTPAAMDASNNYPGKGDWIYLNSWIEVSTYGFYTDWLIRAGVGYHWTPSIYIQPGTQEIKGLATNLGTFPELDFTCYAEIYDYIDDPENGTLLYEDNITNIDLDEPLGGTQALVFDDFNFAREGIYVLSLDMSNINDDYPKNNKDKLIVLVDDTKPVTTHALDPATPDGDNGWYVSDVEVTLDAYDPFAHDVASGVEMIKYTIDGGTTQKIYGNHGEFVIDTDKENLPIEYWAIDHVGNEESHHTFTIDMDQTPPSIDLIYSWEDGPNPGKGPWRMIFTATASDETSQMNYVRFLINNVEQNIVPGPGPEYVWDFLYYGGLYLEIIAEAYDKAGNMNYDEIIDPENFNNIYNNQGSRILQNIYKSSSKIGFFVDI